MKLMILALTTFFSLSSYAQIYFGTSHEYEEAKIFKKIDDNFHNNILNLDPDAGYLQCQKDHTLILDIVRNKHKVHIGQILTKIEALTQDNEYEGYVQAILKKQLLDKVINYMILSEMKKELKGKSIKRVVSEQFDNNPKTNSKIFEMKYQGIDVDAYFSEALNAAAKFKGKNSLPNWLLNEIKAKLIIQMISMIGTSTYKVVVNGVAIQFASKAISGAITKEMFKAGLKKSVISFSGNLLASAGKGLLLELLTFPLKGSRLPPETLWLDLLNDYPGIIVNPELMRSGGIHDGDWNTHCSTINRRAHSLERRITKLEKNLDKEFSSVMSLVNKSLELDRYGLEEQFRVKVDNTYVSPSRPLPRMK